MLLRIGMLFVLVGTFVLAAPMTYGEAGQHLCADSWECQLGREELVSVASEALAPVLTAGTETKPTFFERLEDLLLACFESRGCLARTDTLAQYLMETP